MTEIRIYDRGWRVAADGFPTPYRYEVMELNCYMTRASRLTRALTLAGAERRARRLVARRDPVRVFQYSDPHSDTVKPAARNSADDQTAALP